MLRTLRAYVNDVTCSRIKSNFNRIEVDGETVWEVDALSLDEELRLPELVREMKQKAEAWDAAGLFGAARVARRWAAWLEGGESAEVREDS